MVGAKFLIFILVLFIMGSGLMYDRYQVEQGKMSPVGEFIDYVGLSHYMKWNPSGKSTRYGFRQNRDEYLKTMSDQFAEIEAKRQKFIGARRDLLNRISALNADIGRDALAHYNALEADQARFLETSAALQDWKEQVFALADEPDPQVRLARFRELKGALFAQMGVDEETAMQKLGPLIKSFPGMEKLLTSAPEELPVDCDALEACLQEQIGRGLEMSAHLTDGPLSELIQQSERMDQETRFYLENFEATDRRIRTAQSGVEERLKDLSMNIMQVTDKDLAELLDLYNNLMETQQLLADNLDLNQKRYHSSIQSLIRSLAGTRAMKQEDADRTVEELTYLLAQAKETHYEVQSLYRDQWEENMDVVRQLSASTGFNYDQNREVREVLNRREKYLQTLKSLQVAPSAGFRSPGRPEGRDSGLSNRPVSRGIANQPLRPTGPSVDPREIQRRSAEQYRRLRDKAQDNGFYR